MAKLTREGVARLFIRSYGFPALAFISVFIFSELRADDLSTSQLRAAFEDAITWPNEVADSCKERPIRWPMPVDVRVDLPSHSNVEMALAQSLASQLAQLQTRSRLDSKIKTYSHDDLIIQFIPRDAIGDPLFCRAFPDGIS